MTPLCSVELVHPAPSRGGFGPGSLNSAHGMGLNVAEPNGVRTSASEVDIEVEPIESEEEDYVSSPPEYQIAVSGVDFSLQVLHDKWRSGEILIPKFQRGYVWSAGQASKLIESFLAGLPVPPVFLYTEQDTQKHLVVDGHQRLRSISYFFDGAFKAEGEPGYLRNFQLQGLGSKSRWAEKSFTELSEQDQRRLRNSTLHSVLIAQLDPNDDTSIYHIFERLNTGGTSLKNQEVRNCVYSGPFNDMLMDLNNLPQWRVIVGKPHLDSRLRDAELILRFMALLERAETYAQPMKDFMSRFMKRNRFANRKELKVRSELFATTCQRILEGLGPRPFHVWSGLNAAVCDSVMVAFARNPTASVKRTREKFADLVLKSGLCSERQGTHF